MKIKKIPQRTCVITHEKLDKKDLFRVVRNKDGEVFIDETGKMNGRGAYLKKDKDVIEKARTSKILEQRIKTVPSDEYRSCKTSSSKPIWSNSIGSKSTPFRSRVDKNGQIAAIEEAIIFFKLLHPEKTAFPIETSDVKIWISFIAVHPSKA